MAVYLAVACGVFDIVLFCAVLVLDGICNWIESVPENFPTYSFKPIPGLMATYIQIRTSLDVGCLLLL